MGVAGRLSDSTEAGLEADVSAFIDEVNQAFPAVALKLSDVTLVHRGLVPAAAGARPGHVALARHERVIDRNDNVITVAGTKYTTARAVAERVTDAVFKKLGRPAVPCRTDVTPLPFKRNVELVDAVRDEMVVTLADAVLRRTPLGAVGCPSDTELAQAAAIVSAELGWSSERTAAGDRRRSTVLCARWLRAKRSAEIAETSPNAEIAEIAEHVLQPDTRATPEI